MRPDTVMSAEARLKFLASFAVWHFPASGYLSRSETPIRRVTVNGRAVCKGCRFARWHLYKWLRRPNSVVYKRTAFPPCKSGLRGHIAKYAAEEKISPSTRGQRSGPHSRSLALRLSPLSRFSRAKFLPRFVTRRSAVLSRIAVRVLRASGAGSRNLCDDGSARSSLRHFPEKISPTTSRRRRRRTTPLFDKVSKKGIHLSRDRKGRISYHFGFGRRTKSFIIKGSPTNGTAAAVKECTYSSVIEGDNRIWVPGGHLLDRHAMPNGKGAQVGNIAQGSRNFSMSVEFKSPPNLL